MNYLDKSAYSPANERITSTSHNRELTLCSEHIVWRTLVTTVAGGNFCLRFRPANGSFSVPIELQGSSETISTPVSAAPAISFETSSAGRNRESIYVVDNTALRVQSIAFAGASPTPSPTHGPPAYRFATWGGSM
jgi:hypothetical protein